MAWLLLQYLSNKSILRKVIEREMWISLQPTILHQIFCEFMLYPFVIFKSIAAPDDNF